MKPGTPAIEPRAGVDYRPDIDGLRGIAVAAVVLFHAFPQWLRSGFVGVDVFFVISGYLITRIVLDDLHRGRFSFAHFYARRVRRLFPALLVVLAAVWLVSAALFLDSELRRVSRHIAGAAAFVANFVFWNESGYFATAAQEKPLLHLWSLGIEEQFYLVWPMLLVLMWKRPGSLLALVFAAGMASLALNFRETLRDHDAAFFLPAPRFWELLAGVFVAVAPRVQALGAARARLASRTNLRMAAAVAGLAAIAAATFAIRDVRLFPGAWALLPVLGTAVVIATGPDTPLHRRVLGHPALVGLGLVSYALYLWHWPLISFAHILGEASPRVNAALVCASGVLAWVTWRFVERPIRGGRGFPRAKVAVLAFLMAGIGALGILGELGIATTPRQAPSRVFTGELAWTYDKSPRLQAVEFRDSDFPGAAKLREDLVRHAKVMAFRSIASGNPRKALFIGDSHMEHYWPRVDQVILDHGARSRSAVFLTASAFLPITGVRIDPATNPQMQGLARAMVDYALSDPSIDTVVIASIWGAHFAEGRGWPDSVDSPYYVMVDGKPQHLHGGRVANDLALRELSAMMATLRRAGKRVFLLQAEPGGPWRVIRHWSGPELLAPPVPASSILEADRELRARLARVAHESGAVVLDPIAALCSGGECPATYEGGHLVYMDATHFSDRFARRHLGFIDTTLLGP